MTNELDEIKRMETMIIKTLIQDALDYGCAIVIDNGEDKIAFPAMDSYESKETLTKAILHNLWQTEDERLLFYKGHGRIGFVRLIYNNSGYDVIADHTDSEEIENLVAGASELADKLEYDMCSAEDR